MAKMLIPCAVFEKMKAVEVPAEADSAAKFVQEFTLADPDTGEAIRMEVYKDPTSNALFAIDASYREQNAGPVRSPYHGRELNCSRS